MPLLVDPALPPGALSSSAQPRLGVEGDLVLRPWRASDVTSVKTAFGCPEIQRWHTLRLDSEREARAWIAGWADRWANETDASWAIVTGADDLAVGQVGLRTVVLFEASVHLSYWVLPAARGRGLASRAVRTLSRWAFHTVGLHRLVALHSTANAASCRAATRAGLAIEGTLRAAARHADGWHDMHVHAGLRPSARGTAAASAPDRLDDAGDGQAGSGTLDGSSGPGMGSTGGGGNVVGVSGESSPGSSGTGSLGSMGG